MGLFKMLILVLALNYELGEATGLSQAMVVGTALPNFLTIIFRRHPRGHTSLVNYPLL
jgi:cytochrome bd-type quinol oxidase subunit 1